jgi:hypothetical protein
LFSDEKLDNSGIKTFSRDRIMFSTNEIRINRFPYRKYEFGPLPYTTPKNKLKWIVFLFFGGTELSASHLEGRCSYHLNHSASPFFFVVVVVVLR